jgi:hypothetical protein
MRNKKFKYQTYLKNGQGNIKHIILTQKAEFRSRFNHFWGVWASTLIALPYFVIALLLYLVYEYSDITTIQVICMVAVFSLIPLGYVAIEHLKSTIEDYIFDEYIFPQIEQKYIQIKNEDFED